MYKTAIVTLSDKSYAGLREDGSKKVIEKIITAHGYFLSEYILIPDEPGLLRETLIDLCDNKKTPLILTTGGTGFSKRDITPDVTKEVIEKEALGLAEAMRMNSLTITKRAMLSRQTAGIRGSSLIINLPGSPKACKENLEFIITELGHGLQILLGEESECAKNILQ
ncbi:MAG: MogA/MoaB family molybdenum cofactor biosynthesis protein [Clostridiales bacterium]|nr:MogA/MoaB family molybdenum cofactor biosynthesis protein [Clostridiales bacterium]